tara:strand:+ start:8109 stop:8438 length:330 start_codon:yes stop_codon:yes gene_type:complete
MISVVNKYKHTPTSTDVYIGRGSALGNPYTGSKSVENTKAEYQCESREVAIAKYKEYLMLAISEKNRYICDELNKIWLMAKSSDINLVCFCKPKPCHGDIIKKVIENTL